MNYLYDGLLEIGIPSNDTINVIQKKLEQYIAEIEIYNPRFGLVGNADKDTIIIRHILDSLAPFQIIKNNFDFSLQLSFADIGSGAGFPGIPLSIIFPNSKWTLVEKKMKRVSFLQNTKNVLKLDNVEIMECGVEDITKKELFFDGVFCRAFSEINDSILKLFFSMLKKNGKIIFYKGRKTKIETELQQCASPIKTEVIPCAVPFLEEERNLVICA